MKIGLDGVVAAETVLSEVDGEAGDLLIRGYRLEEFTALGFEGASEALVGEVLDLGAGRLKAYFLLKDLLGSLSERSPVEALRMGLAVLPSDLGLAELVGAFPVILGAARHGESLLPPNPERGQVADLLAMFTGEEPEQEALKALSCYLVAVSEHGMNASTFTARVIASTGAPCLDAVLGALSALKGPLHGGAPGPVLDLLDEMMLSDDIAEDLRRKIATGERLMGFGHRVYRTRDPRADVLKEALLKMDGSPRLQVAQHVERLAEEALQESKPGRHLRTNVEFYTAVLLDRVGFPRSYFTPLFAMGRVLGWIAHYQEQRASGRLIRPASIYVGPRPTRV